MTPPADGSAVSALKEGSGGEGAEFSSQGSNHLAIFHHKIDHTANVTLFAWYISKLKDFLAVCTICLSSIF